MAVEPSDRKLASAEVTEVQPLNQWQATTHESRKNVHGLSPTQQLQKAILDYTLATILLIFLIIPLLCIALAIRFDSKGPIFFRQPRIGLDNRLFKVWKFRTMHHDVTDLYGTKLTMRNDTRITRVG